MPRSAHLHKRCFSIFCIAAQACASKTLTLTLTLTEFESTASTVGMTERIWLQKNESRFKINFFKIKNNLSLKHNTNQNKQQYAIHTAETTAPGLQSVQEGDAQVLFKAPSDEAHGHPTNAGTVFERIKACKAANGRAQAAQANGRLRPTGASRVINHQTNKIKAPLNDGAFINCANKRMQPDLCA